jgi:phosphoglycolate phosphatase
MKYKYIFLDLDGTLTDSKEGILNCVKYALSKFGIEENDNNKLMKYAGPPLYVSFTTFNGFDDQEAKKAIEYYRERFATIGIFENRAYDGAEELLKKLTDAGRILVLATSKPRIYAEQIVKKYRLRPYLKFISGAELDGTRDLKTEVIEYAIKQTGITDRNKIIMVGDRKQDILAAKECGIASCGVSFGYAEKGELENAGADYIVNDFEELYKILIR